MKNESLQQTLFQIVKTKVKTIDKESKISETLETIFPNEMGMFECAANENPYQSENTYYTKMFESNHINSTLESTESMPLDNINSNIRVCNVNHEHEFVSSYLEGDSLPYSEKGFYHHFITESANSFADKLFGNTDTSRFTPFDSNMDLDTNTINDKNNNKLIRTFVESSDTSSQETQQKVEFKKTKGNKYTTVTTEDKVKLIDSARKYGWSEKQAAAHYGIDLKRYKYWVKSYSNNLELKENRGRKSAYPETEQRVMDWHENYVQLTKEYPSSDEFCKKAIEFSKSEWDRFSEDAKTKTKPLNASKGWLTNMKKRYSGLRFKMSYKKTK